MIPRFEKRGGRFVEIVRAEMLGLGVESAYRVVYPERIGLNDVQWVLFQSNVRNMPTQGWKLHISARLDNCNEVIRVASRSLLETSTNFKFAADENDFDELDSGRAGLSQVGKFITVYPSDDEHAKHLAALLDKVLRGYAGPVIRSDLRLSTKAPVFARYGGFSDQHIFMPTGHVIPAIKLPNGRLVKDERDGRFKIPPGVQPVWTRTRAPNDKLIFNNRFILSKALSATSRGAVFAALDRETGRPVIAKQALRNAVTDENGRDAVSRLRNEYDVLETLKDDHIFPSALDYVDDGDSSWIFIDYVPGIPLSEYSRASILQYGPLPISVIALVAHDVFNSLAKLHDLGVIYRDLKSSNVILNGERASLIDFELAHRMDSSEMPLCKGTRGYMPPGREGIAEEAADWYAFGALVFHLFSGIEPADLPTSVNSYPCPTSMFHPSASTSIDDKLQELLRSGGDATLAKELVDAVSAHSSATTTKEVARLGSNEIAHIEPSRDDCSDAIRTVVRAMNRDVSKGQIWRSEHPQSFGQGLIGSINTGATGALLGYCYLTHSCNSSISGLPSDIEKIRATALLLSKLAISREFSTSGLYVGSMGVALSLLVSSRFCKSNQIEEAAIELAIRSLHANPNSPDIFVGLAGQLRAALVFYEATHNDFFLKEAERLSSILIARSSIARKHCSWQIPSGHGSLSGKHQYGYAHGAAGIADALTDFYLLTRSARVLKTLRMVANWIVDSAIVTSKKTVHWPEESGSLLTKVFWCHGTAGVLRFLTNLSAADPHCREELMPTILSSADTVAKCSLWSNPTQCHGLAGNLESLLDVCRVTGDRRWRDIAGHFVRASLGLKSMNFRYHRAEELWVSESPRVTSPDLMVGYVGTACAVSRYLSDGLEHVLSVNALKALLE